MVRAAGQNLVKRANKSFDMMIEVSTTIDRNGMPVGEIPQPGRKVADLRHFHASDQDRNDRNAPFECYLDFDPDWVGFVIDSALNPPNAAQPLWPYDNKQDVRCPQSFGNLNAKIVSGLNIVDVTKHRALAILLSEAVKNTPSDILRIRSTI